MDKKVKLTLPNQLEIELPFYEATMGNPVIDIGALGKYGVFTYDPGFLSTAACKSSITYIDGAAGKLLYRGYDIVDLAEKSNYLEVCYLLINGDLPSSEAMQEFSNEYKNHTMVHEQLSRFYNGFPRNAHPMAIMCGVVGGLSAFYHDSLDINNQEHHLRAAVRLIAKMPTLASRAYKYSIGHPFVYPQNSMSYAENFLHMLFATPTKKTEINPVIADAMDKIFILHADHEQNASTSTVRMAGSSQANPFACIAAGITALWGDAHGGANEASLRMLEEIGSCDNIDKFIAKAKDPNDSFRLMGFGHRVYKNFDPRAKIMRECCHKVLKETKADSPLFEVALKLEEIALKDDYFIEKNLYPNVDFYSGIILSAIGIPKSMFTVIFAMSRTVGWISHWIEMVREPKLRISRPRQLYQGPNIKEYVNIDKRK